MANFEARGVFTALVTPFTEDGSHVDFGAFERLLESQLDGGVAGLIPCGTTGETPTLSDEEQREVIRRTVTFAAGRLPVMAGTGSNSTKKTIELSNAAFELGADAVMVVMPYYNKPSQEGMLRHMQLVASAVRGPIFLYNIPGRTGVDLSVETTLRLIEEFPNIVGIKDATGTVFSCQGVLASAKRRFAILAGDDALALPMMSVGATGVISVTSNLYPRQVSEVLNDYFAGRLEAAQAKNLKLFPVHRAMFCEPNPQPVKAALALKGVMHATVRPPLVELGAASRALVERTLATYEAS